MMDGIDDKRAKEVGGILLSTMELLPREDRPAFIIGLLDTAIQGAKAGLIDILNKEIVAMLGEHYDGPGKLRDRVRALEHVAAIARGAVRDDRDPMSARIDILAALDLLDATTSPQTG